MEAIKQTVNPGGVLDPQEIVGRDELIRRLWRILEKNSVYITGERRTGKSSIVRDKMGKEPPAGTVVLYLDVSRASSALELVEALLAEARMHLDRVKQAKFAIYGILQRLTGTEIPTDTGSVKLPDKLAPNWKELLQTLLRDLAAQPTRFVLALDELPLLLDAIRRRDGENVVMELLSTLREARQDKSHPSRMIFTGSLGLHHVLTTLQTHGYQNDPTNDMTLIELEPLSLEDAVELARRLLRGEEADCDDLEAVASHLAQSVDGMPYYIQNLVSDLSAQGEQATANVIDQRLEARLRDMADPWHLQYFDERIATHYPQDLCELARALLDQLSFAQTPLSLEVLTESLDPERVSREREVVLRTIRLLGKDHYLQEGDDGLRFRYPFMARVWRQIRRLK